MTQLVIGAIPEVLSFIVEGEPIPKGRARTRVVHTPDGKDGKSFATHYTPAATRAWERKIRETCTMHANLSRWTWNDKDRFALLVRVYRTHEGAGGDLDNLVKAVSDGINGVAYPDDRRIRALEAFMQHDRRNPRLFVSVRRMRIGEQLHSAKESDHGQG